MSAHWPMVSIVSTLPSTLLYCSWNTTLFVRNTYHLSTATLTMPLHPCRRVYSLFPHCRVCLKGAARLNFLSRGPESKSSRWFIPYSWGSSEVGDHSALSVFVISIIKEGFCILSSPPLLSSPFAQLCKLPADDLRITLVYKRRGLARTHQNTYCRKFGQDFGEKVQTNKARFSLICFREDRNWKLLRCLFIFCRKRPFFIAW